MGGVALHLQLHAPISHLYLTLRGWRGPSYLSLSLDGEPHMRSNGSSDFSASNPIKLSGTSTHAREVVDTTVAIHAPFSLPPPPLLLTNLE